MVMDKETDKYRFPMPDGWNQIYVTLLKIHERLGAKTNSPPPIPLILGGWWESSDRQKHERWIETIEWAKQHGALSEIAVLITRIEYTDHTR